MTEYLVFTLSAALGSMGDLAGHERRGSLGWPGRSAILGLCAAALGIRRDDAEGLATLNPLRTAVAIFDEGTPLRDYHTVQTVPTATAKRPDSRPAALRQAGGKVNTTITLRDYRQGALFGVALWGAELGPLCEALNRPVFTLYLGRKSCPLSAPLWPWKGQVRGVEEALAHVTLPPWRATAEARLIAADSDAGLTGREEWRQDQPTDRTGWHFAPRRVVLAQSHVVPGSGP